MNTNKFTPGPWVIKAALGSKGEHCFWDISPASNEDESYRGNVCRVSDAGHICGISLEESRANAQLIAAAPDLLLALQMIVSDVDSMRAAINRPFVDIARVAIRKAIGEKT